MAKFRQCVVIVVSMFACTILVWSIRFSLPASRLAEYASHAVGDHKPSLVIGSDKHVLQVMTPSIDPSSREVQLEQTDRTGGEGTNAFSHILLVLVHSYYHHTAKIDPIYRKFFWDILYLAPKHAYDHEKFVRHGFALEVCNRYRKDNVQYDFKSYLCLERVLRYLLGNQAGLNITWDGQLRKDGRQQIKGVLVAHSDFWFSPPFVHGMDFSKIWVLGGHTNASFEDATCRAVGDTRLNLNAWHWPMSKNSYDAAVEKLKKVRSYRGLRSDLYCGGWSDLYYLPRESWTSWAQASNILREYALVNEIGAILAHLASMHAGSKVQFLHCWGSYMTKASYQSMKENACGHKMDLLNPSRIKLLSEMWPLRKDSQNLSTG